MDTNKQHQTALEIIATVSGHAIADITPDKALVGDLGIDSPKALNLLVELEDTLQIEISDEAAARLDYVKDILEFLDNPS